MNLLSIPFFPMPMVFMIMFVLTGFYFLPHVFSEFSSNPYTSLLKSGSQVQNETINTGCDFLNLCKNYIVHKIGNSFLVSGDKVIDASYLNSYLNLPFP